MLKTGLIFPGQGAQNVGMGYDVTQISPGAKEVYARACDVLGFDITHICFSGPAEELERTDIQQPAIFVTSVALWQAFVEAGGSRDHFVSAAGLSLGEYTALYAAGAVEFDDALRLVQKRGALMQEAALTAPSGMVSLIGADESTARALCEQAREDDVLVPANFNCPGQIVISGSKAACLRAVDLAGSHQCRAVPLAVAGAFHSPLMKPAATGLRKELERVEFSPPAIPVASNVNAEYHQSPATIREWLEQQLTQPVLWQRCIERMVAEGVEKFVEIGPGRILTGLLRKIDRKIRAQNASSAESIQAAVSAIA